MSKKYYKKISFIFVLIFVLLLSGNVDAKCLKRSIDKYNKGEIQKALKSISKCKQEEILDFILYYRAKLLMEADEASLAMMEIDDLLKRYPNFPMMRETKKLVAVGLLKTGHPDQAAQVLTKDVLSHGKSTFSEYRMLVLAWLNADRGLHAQEILKKAIATIQRPSDWNEVLDLIKQTHLRVTPEIIESAAESLFANGRWKSADKMARFYMNKWPDNPHGFLMVMGKVAYREDRFVDAEKIFVKVMSETTAGMRKSSVSWLAKTYAKQNKFDQSITLRKYLHAQSKGKKRWRLRYQIGFLYQDAGNYTEAIKQWNALLTARGRGAYRFRGMARWWKGWCYYQKKDYKLALANWRGLQKKGKELSVVGSDKVNYWVANAYGKLGDVNNRKKYMGKIENEIDYYAWLARLKLYGKKIDAMPMPQAVRLKCKLPKFEKNKRWEELEGVDEALRVELKGTLTAASAKKALDEKYYDIAYRHGRDLLVKYLEYPPENELGCLAWNTIYVTPYEDVLSDLTDQKLPSDVVWSVMMTESAFIPDVVSPVGAQGIMQLMPVTAIKVADSLGIDSELDLLEPNVNIPLGVIYLRGLAERFEMPLAFAAYNAGEAAVDRWLEQRKDWPIDSFIESIPYSQTRNYVKKVMARIWNYRKISR